MDLNLLRYILQVWVEPALTAAVLAMIVVAIVKFVRGELSRRFQMSYLALTAWLSANRFLYTVMLIEEWRTAGMVFNVVLSLAVAVLALRAIVIVSRRPDNG